MAEIKGSGGLVLVDALHRLGTRRISCVAGESYLPVLDALLDYPDIDVITCRHEGGAGFMAESWGKLSGQPGICFVTRGPGVCNASIAVHTAKQDSTPLIVFMGQVRRWERGREAFQEVDVRAVFGDLAKWAVEIDDPSRIPEIVNRAWHVATTGRPGPVVIGLPEDMLSEMTTAVQADYAAPEPIGMTPAALDKVATMIRESSRPLVILGGAGWDDAACAEFASFASAAHLPVAAAFRRHDLIDHRHACYVGELGTGPNPKLLERVKQSDLLIVVGARLDEITTQSYALIDAPVPTQKLIHIHADAAELGKVYTPTLAIQADMIPAASALAGIAFNLGGRERAGWKDDARADFTAWTDIDLANRPTFNGPDMTAIFSYLRDVLPDDAVVTTDAGNFSGWAQRYLRYRRPGRLLAPLSGAMGYAVPSAVGASIHHPDRVVLGLCGDGGFMMTGQELATAIHHGAHPVIMICNNGMYGTIRMHQERKYPGRTSATTLTNPDFVALAQAYGAFTARVTKTEEFAGVWDQAVNAGRVAVIEIAMDPRQLTTNAV
ncbi:thiamine pyrophosphate-dependent enzyme [Micavibrio aeruginosavorus]|uniref:Thiamine pyrophosphate-requiring enzyme n=1 Tax=Micavibrio aeruginosavorus EPB TaxID=349215 RepID=M4VE97_9BACT|nr:thiamine pyrophosphate-dependent enzyme [Micavibrio aeruginosavorus]AGH97528.1 Thiamine pyrophosphate-requiring enzyme [Micavibrio aeruginosavorus EPB]